MSLEQSFEKQGNFLFKYRGQFPIILFLLAISLRSSPEIIRFISGVFLVDQVFFTDFNIINPIIWSLEVELQFYFIIYVLLLIRKKLGIIIKPFKSLARTLKSHSHSQLNHINHG